MGAAGARAQSDVGVTGFPPPPLTAGQSEVLLNGAPTGAPLNSWYPVWALRSRWCCGLGRWCARRHNWRRTSRFVPLRTPASAPRLVTSTGGLRRLNAIVASALQWIRPSALRRAPLPKGKIAAAVHVALGLPVLSDVGALAVNANRLQPGGRLSVIALGLAAGSDHAAAVVLDGRQLPRDAPASRPLGRNRRDDPPASHTRRRPLDDRRRGPLGRDHQRKRPAGRYRLGTHGIFTVARIARQ